MDDYELPPWGFSRDVLELRHPDAFHHLSYDTTEGGTVKTEVREYRLPGLTTVLLFDLQGGALPAEPAEAAHEAWTMADKPVPFRLVWHSYESWGDSYEEEVWMTEGGQPVVVRGYSGKSRLVADPCEEGQADELMELLAQD